MPAPTDTILLYTDIVGYTRLLRADREDALAKLEQFQSTMRAQVEEYEGRILQAQRDSCLAGFERAADAVHCAEALQRLFQGTVSIPVRMGLHAGAVVEKDGHAFGEGVVAVTQLERVGGAGSVVLSQAVRDQLGDDGDWATEALGRVQLDRLDHPLELYALAGKGLNIPDRPQPEEESASDRRRWSHALKLFAGYLVAAWTVLQFVDWLLMRYQISPYWTDILLWTFVGIIPSLLIYLVHQDRINEWRLLRREKIIIPLNILFLLGGLGVAYGGAELGSITQSISFTDIDGSTVTQTVVKPEFVQELSLFPFEQKDGADSTDWIGAALEILIEVDLSQDKYLSIYSHSGGLAEAEKIDAAKITSGAYYIDGSYRVTETGFAITPVLKDKRDGSVVAERTFRGGNFFTLVDSISMYLRREVGLTPAQMKQSVDLEIKEYITDNFAALRSSVKGIMGRGNVHFERALELDSTFAATSAAYARRLHHAPRGQLEAKHNIALAMRHRKKLPAMGQMTVMLTYYQIWGEWDKAEKLIDLQLEMAPNDASILREAIGFYVLTGQLGKSRELMQHYVTLFPSSGLRQYLLWLNLRMGEFAEVEKAAKTLLQEMPQNLSVQLLLATTYIHQQEYAAAREIVEQILIIDPDKEKILSPLLEAITYMQANPDYFNSLNRYEGFYRNQGSEAFTEFYISQRGIWARTMNTGGVFVFPSAKNHLAGAYIGECYLSEYLENDAGEIYALILRHCTHTRASYHWKQDSLFWQAEELLRARDYERAATAYDKLLAEHPEQFYLYDAQAHLDYMASKTEAEIQELYQRYVGDYDGVTIRIENGELLYKRPGFPRRILRPISDTEFMALSRYDLRFAFDVEQEKVKGIYYYRYYNEAREWRQNEEYLARTQLAD